jgi:hypothetical protein
MKLLEAWKVMECGALEDVETRNAKTKKKVVEGDGMGSLQQLKVKLS